MPARTSRTRAPRHRSYAMVMALLTTVSATAMIAVMIERQMTQRLSAARQIDAYQRHHSAKGFQEIIDSWIRSLSGQSLASLVTDGGVVLTLDLGDGIIASVAFADAQGSVLASPSGLSGQDYADARAMKAFLPRGVRDPGLPPLTREVGPLAVSMRSAPPEVLEAAFSAIAGTSGAREFAQRLLTIRSEGPIQQSDLAKVGIALSLPGEIRARLNDVLVPEPSLWFVTVEIRGGLADSIIAREGGHIVVPRRTGRSRGQAIWEKSSSFLTWRKLPIQ